MTNLTGSEKQIKWAEDIRARCLDKFQDRIADLNGTIEEAIEIEDQEWEESLTKKRDAAMEVRGVLETVSSAAWWIDYGRSSVEGLVTDYRWFKRHGSGKFNLII